MKRHSIGLVVPSFDKGGLEEVTLNLYRGYRRKGHQVTILVESSHLGYIANLVDPVDLIALSGIEDRLLRTIANRKIDVLHYQYSTFGLRELTTLGFISIYTLQNVYTWLNDDDFERHAAKVLSARAVVASSSFSKRYFCERIGGNYENVRIIPNGIGLNFLDSTNLITRSDLTIPKGSYVFANVASTHRNKHQNLIIAAAEELLQTRTDFYILLVANVGDPDFHSEINERLSQSPARNHIGLRDFIQRDKLASLYRDVVDCVLLPSIQEGCSNVVLEAIACGKPMIITDVGNAREARALSQHVRIIPRAYDELLSLTPDRVRELTKLHRPKNTADLTAAMQDCIGDKTEAKASDAALEAVSAERMVDAYCELIDQLEALQ